MTAASWRDYITKNDALSKKEEVAKIIENPKRIPPNKMSIEMTHLILICKGPEAEEFQNAEDMGESNRFGNLFTRAEYLLFNIHFFANDSLFQYYVLYFGISLLGFFSHEIFYSFHLLDVLMRFPELQNVVKSVTSNSV